MGVALALLLGCNGAPCDDDRPTPGQVPGGPCLFGHCPEGTRCLESGGSICAPYPRPEEPICGAPSLGKIVLGDVCVSPCEADDECPPGQRCAALGACVWALCVEEED